MTNIPYASNEKDVWINQTNNSELKNDRFRTALRIDLFMQEDWSLIADILVKDGFESSKEGLTAYLEKWIQIMSPEYLMASDILYFYLFLLRIFYILF